MNLHWIDWSINAVMILIMVIAVVKTRKYTRSVADYLAANRCAGRYLISVADTMAVIGTITIIALFEAYYKAGFTFGWWGMLGGVMFFVALSGWVQYRFRQTRALTMAQFLEMRYGKSFRVFFGIQAFISGVLGFGIFPAVGGRFFKYYCGFPTWEVPVFGVPVDLTLGIIMAILLGVSLFFTFAGGQIGVIVTDFIQSVFSNVAFLAVMIFLMIAIPWTTLYDTVIQRPPGESMIDPFDASKISVFNVWFFVIHIVLQFWYYMSHQGNQGYNSSALNPHEARMAKSLGVWRMSMQGVPIIIIAMMAYVIMHNDRFGTVQQAVAGSFQAVDPHTTEVIRNQVMTSVVMSQYLPIGLVGALCSVMLASFIASHDTCLHSWGSIFIQDIVLPFRKTRLSQVQHLRWLKFSAVGVAVFVLLFSLFFTQFDYIFMYLDLIGISGAGAGSVIIFGLYWRRGTTAAAFTSMIIGVVAFVASFILQKYWLSAYGAPFPLNSRYLMLICMLLTIAAYVAVSLLARKPAFNMDKMLHRGDYAIADETVVLNKTPLKEWMARIGITQEFTQKDKAIFFFFTLWQLFWFFVFGAVLVIRIFVDIPDPIWSAYWKYSTWMNIVLAVATMVWFTIGGVMDMKKMFRKLESKRLDTTDDGEL